MEQYINKSALVAEIKRRIKEIEEIETYLTLTNLLCYIDTLEVKEVDLEKESLTWEDIGTIDQLLWDLAGEHRLDNEGYYKAVLGRFKAQKGE